MRYGVRSSDITEDSKGPCLVTCENIPYSKVPPNLEIAPTPTSTSMPATCDKYTRPENALMLYAHP